MTEQSINTLFVNGTESVVEIDQKLYVEGIGYQFKVIVDPETKDYFVSGKVRKETDTFLANKLG